RDDKDGDSNSIDPSKKPIIAALDTLRTSPEATAPGKAVYTSKQLLAMGNAIGTGTPGVDQASLYNGKKQDYLGRKISDRAVQLDLAAGSSGEVTAIYDPSNNRFYKQLGQKPPVPMTAQEIKDLGNNLKGHHPNNPESGTNNDSYKRLFVGLFPK